MSNPLRQWFDSAREKMADTLDLARSRSVDISQCQSVCLALGPYRNLTTLTAATLFLHPNCQVLNHAGGRIFGNTAVDFLSDYRQKKLDRFIQYAVELSLKGGRGNKGGSITHSHAFDHDGMKAMHEKVGTEKQKGVIRCLFWKESLITSNLIKNKKVDLGAIFAQEPRLRFLLPVRNPMDCARSNLKTGHADLFHGLNTGSSMPEMTRAILDEIHWFASWQAKYPDRFFHYFEHDITPTMLENLARFLDLSADPVWIDSAATVMKTKPGYAHDEALVDEYRRYVGEKFAEQPAFAEGLLKFVS